MESHDLLRFLANDFTVGLFFEHTGMLLISRVIKMSPPPTRPHGEIYPLYMLSHEMLLPPSSRNKHNARYF